MVARIFRLPSCVCGGIMTQILLQCYSEMQETGLLVLDSGTALFFCWNQGCGWNPDTGFHRRAPQVCRVITCISSPLFFKAGTSGGPRGAEAAEPDLGADQPGRVTPEGHWEQGPRGAPGARDPRWPERVEVSHGRGPGPGPGAHPSGVVRPPRPSCFRGPPRGGFAADDISCGCWKRGGGAGMRRLPPFLLLLLLLARSLPCTVSV